MNEKKSDIELQGRIKDFISRITRTEFTDDEIPDIFNDEEKLRTYYAGKVLELISDRVAKIKNERGDSFVYRLIMESVLHNESPEVLELLKAHFEDLLPGNEEEYGTVDFDEYIDQPLDSWDRFMLAVGISPRYKAVLQDLFGDFGLVSIAALLQSLSEGKLSAFAFHNLIRELRE